jgi:hypothetical protein
LARPAAAAFAAGCIATLGFAASAFAAMSPDMNAPPVPWKNTGAKPVVQVDAQKHPTSIALVIPAVLIDTLPKKRSEAVYPVQGGGLVQTANLQWHPMGHEPEHVYDTPHFDVHFYTITESVRGSIVPNAPAGKVMPYKGTLPRGVILAPGYVPGMGMHAIPHEQPEFNHGKFTVSPIIGYWNGDLAFFEVMFTKDWLVSKAGKTGAFPQPVSVKQHGYYPTKYSVKYDAPENEYEVAISDFVKR